MIITNQIKVSPPLTIPSLENGDKLTRQEFERLKPNLEGIICSHVFSGLWLDKNA